MTRFMKETLEMRLNQCGLQECRRTVDSAGPELKQCSRQVTVCLGTNAEMLTCWRLGASRRYT